MNFLPWSPWTTSTWITFSVTNIPTLHQKSQPCLPVLLITNMSTPTCPKMLLSMKITRSMTESTLLFWERLLSHFWYPKSILTTTCAHSMRVTLAASLVLQLSQRTCANISLSYIWPTVSMPQKVVILPSLWRSVTTCSTYLSCMLTRPFLYLQWHGA